MAENTAMSGSVQPVYKQEFFTGKLLLLQYSVDCFKQLRRTDNDDSQFFPDSCNALIEQIGIHIIGIRIGDALQSSFVVIVEGPVHQDHRSVKFSADNMQYIKVFFVV